MPNGRRYLTGRKSGRCDLIQQRLKKMVIALIDYGYSARCMAQMQSSIEAAKTGAYDDDVGNIGFMSSHSTRLYHSIFRLVSTDLHDPNIQKFLRSMVPGFQTELSMCK